MTKIFQFPNYWKITSQWTYEITQDKQEDFGFHKLGSLCPEGYKKMENLPLNHAEI